ERTIEVQLASAEQTALAARTLRRLLQDEATVNPSPSEAIVRFQTSRTEAQLAQVLAELVRSENIVTQFREVPTDLEEAFLSFANTTGGEGHEAVPSAPAHT